MGAFQITTILNIYFIKQLWKYLSQRSVFVICTKIQNNPLEFIYIQKGIFKAYQKISGKN